VPVLADPEALEGTARQLSAGATAVRASARRLHGVGAELRWEGEAAGAFRAGLAEEVARLGRAADGLDDAAHALRRHAATVRARQRALAAAAGGVAAGASALLRGLP
jgi:uncharacterized protein YukE